MTRIEQAAEKVVNAARAQERSGRVNFKSAGFHDAFLELAEAVDAEKGTTSEAA